MVCYSFAIQHLCLLLLQKGWELDGRWATGQLATPSKPHFTVINTAIFSVYPFPSPLDLFREKEKLFILREKFPPTTSLIRLPDTQSSTQTHTQTRTVLFKPMISIFRRVAAIKLLLAKNYTFRDSNCSPQFICNYSQSTYFFLNSSVRFDRMLMLQMCILFSTLFYHSLFLSINLSIYMCLFSNS